MREPGHLRSCGLSSSPSLWIRINWIRINFLITLLAILSGGHHALAHESRSSPFHQSRELMARTEEQVLDQASYCDEVELSRKPDAMETIEGRIEAEPIEAAEDAEATSTIAEIVATNPNFFEILAQAFQVADLDQELDQTAESFTVFAPTNEAFDQLPADTLSLLLEPVNRDVLQQILAYHMVTCQIPANRLRPGEIETHHGPEIRISTVDAEAQQITKIEQATLLLPDLQATNGVIHVIDQVLLPPDYRALVRELRKPWITEIAKANPSLFSTLANAIGRTNLSRLLGEPGSFTIFAPTDAAFAALPAGTLDLLLLPSNRSLLQQILEYHIVRGKLTSDQIKPGDIRTLEGHDVVFSTSTNTAQPVITVNEASVLVPDVEAANGVIHVIDRVILPPDFRL